MRRAAFCFLTLLLCSCDDAAAPRMSGRSVVTLTHDVGRVLAGDQASHVFTFTNDTDSTLTLGEHAIGKTCSCATVTPSATTLKPGESTDISVTVNVGSNYGRFSQGGFLSWTGELNKPLRLEVTGLTYPALHFDPPRLTFSEEDVAERRQHSVVLRSDIDVDWSTLSVVSQTPGITVHPPTISDGKAIIAVHCEMPDYQEQLSGALSMTAAVGAEGKTKTIHHTMAVTARNRVNVAVSPPVLLVAQRGTEPQGRCEAVLRGNWVHEGSLESATTDSFDVDWSTAILSGRSMRLSMLFKSTNDEFPARGQLILHFRGGREHAVPYVLVSTSSSKEGSL